MSTSPVSHRGLYALVIGVLSAVLVVMLIAWDYDKQTPAADRKADQLIALYEDRGLPVPANRNQIARVLGEDAAVVCEPIANGVDLGTLKSRLGVGGEFYVRATDVDEDALQGLVLIVQVYCPDELDEVDAFLDDFDFEDVTDLGFTETGGD